jgi:D-glycero-D-manno-heptose 1,7-bisphosphate phosphatase
MRAIFLDRDGVINQNRNDHVKTWSEFEFIPRTLAALRLLSQHGYHIFIVTNQAIVSRGITSVETLNDIHDRMRKQIQLHGGHIHDLRFCPHDQHEECDCRKPRPGMLLDLAERWRIDLTRATMIGDAWTDIAAAHSVGCRAALVRTGRGTEQLQLPSAHQLRADMISDDLWEAANWVLLQEGLMLPHHDPDTMESTRARVLAVGHDWIR